MTPRRNPVLALATALAAGLLLITTGCTTVNIDSYRDSEPALVLEDFFAGPVTAWGVVLDRKGQMKRRFRADIQGTVTATGLVLDEHFTFADGERSRRVWTLERRAPDRWVGRADDVEGEAEGVIRGSVLNWRYRLRIPYQGDTVTVTLDDWMFLHPDGVLFNRAIMRKFGFRVGEIILFFQRHDPQGERRG